MDRSHISAVSSNDIGYAPRIENAWLASLPRSERDHLLPLLRQTSVASGAVLYARNAPVADVFFPVDCIVALTTAVAYGRDIEVALVGPEGILTPAPAGSRRAAFTAVVQFPGRALVMDAEAFHACCEANLGMRRALERWQTALMLQVQGIAACNALHDVEQRLCRWLLQFHERAHADMLPVTQEMLANMLGVQRTTVTLVVHRLKDKGLLRQRRGRIEILELAMLEESACDCHHSLKGAASGLVTEAGTNINSAAMPGSGVTFAPTAVRRTS
jgi:CRP-like cAMP-binding protein